MSRVASDKLPSDTPDTEMSMEDIAEACRFWLQIKGHAPKDAKSVFTSFNVASDITCRVWFSDKTAPDYTEIT